MTVKEELIEQEMIGSSRLSSPENAAGEEAEVGNEMVQIDMENSPPLVQIPKGYVVS